MDQKSYHQGDVWLIPVDEIPAGAVALPDEIVQRGEITGHAHWIPKAQLMQKDNKKYCRVLVAEKMYHGVETTREVGTDHPTIEEIPAGNYEVIVQEEYFPDGSRQVKD